MKELSIQEKAKRYDDAIEKAKDYYHLGDDNHKMAIDAKAVMEYIFPELKESEDKMMIQYFKDLAPFDKADELYEKYGFSHKDAIAWLEKQGGHAKFINGIQVGDKVTRNEDGVLINLSQLNRVAKKVEKQGEKKPADTEKGAKGNEREIPNSAWSEEDEAIHYGVIETEQYMLDVVNGIKKFDVGNISIKKECTRELNWLKSLKDRYTWKPSDEQMNILEYYMHTLACNEHKEILFGLYADLKKLMEE